ncbi:ferrous iron transport protein B [Pyrodictium occultum]|uniref:ferrous iron transport protein B n=1 Tax=Pyrodictium occultum TaxID=2309 RepID=UPI000A8753D1|nr:ferrous iron transport protein B [Pyrodictium occultum]
MPAAGGRRGCDVVAALVGAPNSGKTTLFNRLTGSSELVANWPGATVEMKVAHIRLGDRVVCVVDLPGVYSTSGTGAEEEVTRNFLLENRPDVIITLADGAALERGLALPLELLEAFDNVVVVITKADMLGERGIEVDVEGLERELGVPVVLVSALKDLGIDKLLEVVIRKPVRRGKGPLLDMLLGDLKPYVERLAGLITGSDEGVLEPARARWLAVKLLEGHDWVPRYLEKLLGPERARRVAEEAERIREELRGRGIDLAIELVKRRYDYASRLYERYVAHRPRAREEGQAALGLSRLDLVFLHPVLGPLVSLGTLFLIFLATFSVASGWPLDDILRHLGYTGAADLVDEYSLQNLVAVVMDWLAEQVEGAIPNPVLARMLGEGLLSSGYGLGLVLTFIPLVAVIMAFIGALEDSGLLPRLAVGVDRLFRLFGVSGKAVFPAMLSLGCNVPGVISARIMDSPTERRAVAFALPLVPCSARLTVLLALATVYFHSAVERALAVFTVYLISIILFLVTLKLFTRLKGGKASEIAIELPPTKRPSGRVVWWFTWDKLRHFLVRAGTVIVAVSIVLWLLANYGPQGYLGEAGGAAESYGASIGRAMAPYVQLMLGVDYERAWRIGFGLLGGFIAKEVFLDSLAAVAPVQGQAAGEYATLKAYALQPWQVLALMLATTLYIPCVATLGTIYGETRSWRLTLAALGYDLALATAAAFAVRALATIL